MIGSGTNIGIEYQQRVSSWFLLQLYLKKDINYFLKGLGNDLLPIEICYEAETPIDDLVIKCTNNILFSQIKHNISLSDDVDSEFYSVIMQFVKQYSQNTKTEKYLLITSSLSSKKVRIELNKILDSIRINPQSFSDNPLNKSEKETYDKYYNCWFSISKQLNLVISDEEFINFSKQVFIITFDIENNQPFETATFLQISTISKMNPELLWAILLKKSLEFGSKRLSISIEGISRILKPYLDDDITIEKMNSQEPSWFNMSFHDENKNYVSGVEYIFAQAESGELKGKKCILSIKRFDDNGNLKLTFNNDKFILKNGWEFTSIYRCSTESRLLKFFEKNKIDDDVVYFKSDIDSQHENNTVFAKAWSEKLHLSLENNSNILKCVHCTNYVSEHEITTIEYTENHSPKVGVVHNNCLKSSDRVIGTIVFPFFEDKKWLKHFDIDKWIFSYVKSLNTLEKAKTVKNRSIKICWDDKYIHKTGTLCCGFILSDGSIEYVHKRSKIETFDKDEKDERLSALNKMIKDGKDENDPWCYLSVSKQFGKYSYLVSQKDENERILEVENCFIDNYSLAIKNNYEKAENYYAPLIYLYDFDSNEDFHLGQFFIFLSDPLSINKFLENWASGGIILNNYKIEVIDNDDKFDNFIRRKFDMGFAVLVDPLIDKNFNIKEAIQVLPLSSLEP